VQGEQPESDRKQVLVLGAGVTRAFVLDSPLLTDDYNVKHLLNQFATFPAAVRILESERMLAADGVSLNIERLMTRLEGRMPYDLEQGVAAELDLLLTEIQKRFRQRLERAKEGERRDSELDALAKHVVDNSISCVTFNYDDSFDQKLWEAYPWMAVGHKGYWHPDGGYGFFCRASIIAIQDFTGLVKDVTAMSLLKLHGSINWRLLLGSPRPMGVDGLVHHELWHYPKGGGSGSPWPDDERAMVETHLDPDPFLVPPVLTKTSIVEEPVLRLIWSLAYKELESADEITFVGYSFPPTDMAARFLFREALAELDTAQIKVVNYDSGPGVTDELERQYRDVFPSITDDQFDFRGALVWAREFSGG
jgi:hypothetical protein